MEKRTSAKDLYFITFSKFLLHHVFGLLNTLNCRIYLSQSGLLISLNAASQMTFKLSKSRNYSFWKTKFTNSLFGYNPIYVGGSFPCPDTIIPATGETK